MNVFSKKTPYLFLICILLSLLYGYGQDILPKEKEREIKTSGRYYYSECSAFDEVDAKECALRDLSQIALIEMIKQAIHSDETTMKNTMEMRAQTARLNLTGKIRILAWIEKENVQMDTEPTQTPAPAIVPEQPSIPSESEPVPNPDVSVIADPVVRDLATCETFEQFRRMADGFRRQGKIVYGTNKTSFVNPENCFVAVFIAEQKLIALLDAGQISRIDLLTGNIIQNIEQQFPNNILFWIQIMN